MPEGAHSYPHFAALTGLDRRSKRMKLNLVESAICPPRSGISACRIVTGQMRYCITLEAALNFDGVIHALNPFRRTSVWDRARGLGRHRCFRPVNRCGADWRTNGANRPLPAAE